MRRISLLPIVSLALLAMPAGSAAQGVPSDPEADSPSGVVYEIPAEQGRKDAAPKRGKRRSESGAPGGTSGGSGPNGSSGGSGSPSGGSNAATGGTAGGETSSSAAGHTKPTSIRSENNFGTSSHVPGASGTGGGSDAAGGSVSDLAKASLSTATAGSDGPSDDIVFPLVAVLLAVGAGIGIVAGRRALGGRG